MQVKKKKKKLHAVCEQCHFETKYSQNTLKRYIDPSGFIKDSAHECTAMKPNRVVTFSIVQL